MFIVYHSNSLELFMKFVIDIMSSYRLSNPIKSEVILIENKILEKWIETKLSNYFGISANIAFMNIKSFINDVSKDMLCTHLNTNNFSYDSMFWSFMSIFPKLCINQNYSIIQKYLCNDINQQKCGQLSMNVAALFVEYLIYRSDWLNAWKTYQTINNLDIEHQSWQSEIWRMFLFQHVQKTSDRFNPLDRYIFLLQNHSNQLDYNNLPDRIFIYSVTSIPIIYWKILHSLSYHIDIYLWFISPCIKSWSHFDNKNRFNTNLRKCVLYNNHISQSSQSIKKQYSLSLLNLWGDCGQETLYVLDQLEDIFDIKAFVIPKTNSMLHVLQRNILEDAFSDDIRSSLPENYSNSNRIKINKKRYIINVEDQSVTIHKFHHIQREIEVLHNYLLLMLSSDPTLLPGEIIVMAPNIYHYESVIKSTFNNIFNRKLPFFISGRREYISPIISIIFKILDFRYSRFTSEEILSFLSISLIASKFNISTKEIELIRVWVIESGIRWGLDQNTMKIFDVPVTDHNTWYFGLRRMLLGYAMNNQDRLWENIYPHSYVNEAYIDIIPKLLNFFNVLKKWRDRLIHDHTLIEWIPCMQEIIDDFFDYTNFNEEEKHILFLLKTYWINILDSGVQSGYSKKINVIILRDQLQYKLNKKRVHYQFSPNVINFCDITTTCCIPCKILCIIGMNDDAFPRKSIAYDFNLMLKEKRCGDKDIRKEDYYTFLLTCLLPKDRLYISFISQINHYNNNIEHSSVLIDELLEYIAQNFSLIEDQDLNLIDNVKRLRTYLFQQYSCTPFDFDNFLYDTKKQSFYREWLNAANVISSCSNDLIHFNKFDMSLPTISSTIILFQDLYNFYRHPIRIWFQKRLGVYFYLGQCKQLINEEPFFINDKDRFLLNTKLINYIIHNRNTDELYQENYAAGMMPYGSFGKLYWDNQYEQMHALASQIKIYYSDDVHKLDIDLMFNAIRVTGQLNMIQKNGLIRWKAANLNMKDCFLLWLEHLLYCAMGGTGDSRLFGMNNIWHFPNFSKSIAKDFLFILIDGYCQGMNTPLMLLYRSGGTWMNSMFDWHNKIIYSDQMHLEQARQKLVKTWQGYNGSCFYEGECQDPYLRKLIPFDLSEENMQNIMNTSKRYFFNVMQYKLL